ncbi:MAG: DNA translocase FtsK, partial [Oscillospiraceae bacterium]|nr:DNA translocase FtsK [Oscillospiraceae bacterium]
MATQKKTTKKRTTSKRKAPPKKRPIRREVGGGICLLLALCVGVSYFQKGAPVVDQISQLLRGLTGCGYYAALPALALACHILVFHRGRSITLPLSGALALPVCVGALAHIIGGKTELAGVSAVLKVLWESGLALTSGGVIAGGLAAVLLAGLGKIVSLVLFLVLLAVSLMLAFRLTPAGIADALRSHERVPYEPQEIPARQHHTAHQPARTPQRVEYQPMVGGRSSIDIPLDGEERPKEKKTEKKTGFFTHKSDGLKTPDELLSQREAAAAAAAAAQSARAAARAEKIAAAEPPRIVEPPKIEPEPVIPSVSRPEPVTEARRPVSAPTPMTPSTPAPAAEQKDKTEQLAKAEVAAAAEDVAREIAEGDAAAPVYHYPPIELLDEGGSTSAEAAGAELRNNSRRLAETLKSFGVDATAGDVVRGPSVTRYEFMLDQGVKLSKITNLQDDIALALGASGVRIAPIPDKISVVG